MLGACRRHLERGGAGVCFADPATMSNTTEPLLSSKELASKLGRSLSYVRAMRRRGFKMPKHRTTLTEAMKWLAKHPEPCRHKR